jgi:5-methylcytosine-specific restriction endonuclease McrA
MLCRLRRTIPAIQQQHSRANTAWAAANKEKVKKYKQAYVERNKEAIKAKQQARQKAHPEKRKEVLRRHVSKYRAYYNAKSRARQVRKLQAMPAWVLAEDIALIYEQCDYISRLTGIQHEVDHIVPLKNSIVSGLHVPGNLQILDARANRVKSNYYEGSK